MLPKDAGITVEQPTHLNNFIMKKIIFETTELM